MHRRRSGDRRRAQRRHPGQVVLALLACGVGLLAGLAAQVLRKLIAVVHNLLFVGKLSLHDNPIVHTPPSRWGIGVALAPVIGAFIVIFLVRNFAPEAKGRGVAQVIDAIYYRSAAIRSIVAVVKSVASAVSIGSGGSAGREGPIIQIGAAFGSITGGMGRVSRAERATLVVAGAAAGIAATFNTPIGGMLFAVEILLYEVSVRTLVPVALATGTATWVGQLIAGDHPAFPVPVVHMDTLTKTALLPAYLLLGVVLGLLAVIFIRVLYETHDVFQKIPGRGYLRHATGMALVGVTIVALKHATGHYYVQGPGYATIVDVLNGTSRGVVLLLLLGGLKILATCTTVGSGASGGIFSPLLYVGTTLGAVFGITVEHLFPSLGVDVAAFGLAGMAGLFAGATGAAITAVVMIFEMTRDYALVLPTTLTVAVAWGLRRLILQESIYSMKLAREGHIMPKALHANRELAERAGELELAPADTGCTVHTQGRSIVSVTDRESGDQVRFVTANADQTLLELLAHMRRDEAEVAVVLDDTGEVRGVATMRDVAQAVATGATMFVE